MKIFVGTTEICGWVNLFRDEFKNQGHQCKSFVFERNRFYANKGYDFVLSDYFIKRKIGISVIDRIASLINKCIRKIVLFFLIKYIGNRYDAILIVWNSFLPNNKDLEYFKSKGLSIIVLFVGSDIRHFQTFKLKYDVSQWNFPDYWTTAEVSHYNNYIENVEKYADLIYSVPDQAGLQKKPYYHLQIPIDIENISFKNNKRKVPKILHLPSEPWKKGTDIIEKALLELQKEGVLFEFISKREMLNSEVLSLLQDIDILVDEIVFHGPGVLSFEAMASGCVVATRSLVDNPSTFQPPVLSINASNIKEKLRALILNYNLQQELIIKGREYVEKHNAKSVVVKNMISDLTTKREFDYFPTFENKKIPA